MLPYFRIFNSICMKKLLSLSSAFILILSACNNKGGESLNDANKAQLVKTMDSLYAHNIVEQHSDSLHNVFFSEAIILTPGEDEVKGITAIKDWYKNAFEFGLRSIEYTPTSIIGDDNHFIEIGKSKVGLQIADADTLMYEAYKYIHVWQKQKNGDYKLMRDMWNTDSSN